MRNAQDGWFIVETPVNMNDFAGTPISDNLHLNHVTKATGSTTFKILQVCIFMGFQP